MKKSLMIAIIFLLTMMSFSIAYAGSYNDILDTKYEGIVEALSFLKIVDGVSEKIFNVNKVVTRAELSKMLVIANGYYKYADLLKASSNFKDVKEGSWYYDYVNIATAYELVKGYPDGKFYPDKEVTYSEAVAMILRALGHKYIRDDSEYGWDFNYIQRMRELELNKGMDAFKNSDGAKRGEVAILIWNMLRSNPWIVIEEEGTGSLTYTESDISLLDRAFEGDYELINGKKIKSFSAADNLMYLNIESIGKAELVGSLPIYAIGSKMVGVYDKKDKKVVCVVYDMDCGIVEGYDDDLKTDGYKLKKAKDVYHLGGNGEDYIFYAVNRSDGTEVIERAIALDLDRKIIVDEQKTENGILTINDSMKIDTAEAILLDDKKIMDWKDLGKRDAVLPAVGNDIYILANKYKTADELDAERNAKDNMYFIGEISYSNTNLIYVNLLSSSKSYRYVCYAKIDDFNIGDLVFATIVNGKIVELKKATSDEYEKLDIGRELITDYSDKKDNGFGMIGKYIIDKDTKICLINRIYKNNSDTIIEKCTLEKVDASELQYIDKEVVDIVAYGNIATTIYIERDDNKFTAFYARVKDIIFEKEENKIGLSPVEDSVTYFKVTGRINCEPGDIISYVLSDEETIKIVEVFHTNVIGCKEDLVVDSVKGNIVYLTNGEQFDKSSSVIEVNGKAYKLSKYKVILSNVINADNGWKFTSASFGKMKSVKFSTGDRIAIDEIEGVIIIYSGYVE